MTDQNLFKTLLGVLTDSLQRVQQSVESNRATLERLESSNADIKKDTLCLAQIKTETSQINEKLKDLAVEIESLKQHIEGDGKNDSGLREDVRQIDAKMKPLSKISKLISEPIGFAVFLISIAAAVYLLMDLKERFYPSQPRHQHSNQSSQTNSIVGK